MNPLRRYWLLFAGAALVIGGTGFQVGKSYGAAQATLFQSRTLVAGPYTVHEVWEPTPWGLGQPSRRLKTTVNMGRRCEKDNTVTLVCDSGVPKR